MNLIPWRSKTRNDSRDVVRSWGADGPTRGLDRFFDGVFRDLFRDPWLSAGVMDSAAWGPLVDVSESEKDVVVRAEVPGIDPDDISVSVSDGLLTLAGEKKEESETKGENYHLAERRFGSFRRSVQLPASVDQNKVTANYEDGVLTVTLAKREGAGTRRIPIAAKKR